MDKQELYELLDMKDGEDFQYFENMSELLESEAEIGTDEIFELLQEVDMNTFTELMDGYFDEVDRSVPDSEVDLFTLLQTIRRSLTGMAETAGRQEDREERNEILVQLADEIEKFREWYNTSSEAECVNEMTDENRTLPVRDALLLVREEPFTGDTYRFDFQNVLDYDLDEYIMSYGDLVRGDEGDGEGDEE